MPVDTDTPVPDVRKQQTRVTHLKIADFRNLERLELKPGPDFNGILGPNGAGKTSILECLYLLGRGRSFRPGRPAQLIREGAAEFRINGAVEDGGRTWRLGLRQGTREREARRNGLAVDSAAALAEALPVLVFEPHAHQLVEGGPAHRRRLLDWGVFHVEPEFLASWRRYRRALRQRNAALRGGSVRLAASWEPEMAESGEGVFRMRAAYVERLAAEIPAVLSALAPGLTGLSLEYRPGWNAVEGLTAALKGGRNRDVRLGYSGDGPHRDDLRISLSGRAAARRLSRGQEKLVALALVLTQARLYRRDTGRSAVMLLDDLPSELDPEHLARALACAAALDCQTFVTAVTRLERGLDWPGETRWFHVEQGRLAGP